MKQPLDMLGDFLVSKTSYVIFATLFLFRGFGTWLTSSQAFDFPERIRGFGLSAVNGIPTPIIVFAIIALLAHGCCHARNSAGRSTPSAILPIGRARPA